MRRHYITTCAKSGKECPDAWALATTDEFRTHLSLLDIVPSAVESKARKDSAMFLNHDLLGMFRAMSAHKSQAKW
jgi:hypothetical protein